MAWRYELRKGNWKKPPIDCRTGRMADVTGPGVGVSVHVLCRTPADHPHRFWDRNTEAVHPYPFIEVEPGRWRSEVMWDHRSGGE